MNAAALALIAASFPHLLEIGARVIIDPVLIVVMGGALAFLLAFDTIVFGGML